MKSLLRVAVSATCFAVLSGCGGGGGSEPPAVTRAEGAYSGPLDGRRWVSTVTMVVLENDEVWAPYGVMASGVLKVDSFMHGVGTSRAGTLTVPALRDYFDPWTVYQGSLSATYTPGTQLDGSMTYPVSLPYPNGKAGFDARSSAVVPYRYDTPASLASLTGVWMTGLFGEHGHTTIQANGAFSVVNTDSSGGVRCVSTGQIAARASGKNVFDVTMQIGPAPCESPNSTARGIAILLPDPSPQLVMMAVVDGNTSVGVLVNGTQLPASNFVPQ